MIDQFDLNILEVLTEDARTPVERIAQFVEENRV